MDSGQDKEDVKARDMIDKYAQFVARNGPQFEQVTMIKQANNPRFAFIHPNGPMHDYYQDRLAYERQKYYGRASAAPQMRSAPPPPGHRDPFCDDPYGDGYSSHQPMYMPPQMMHPVQQMMRPRPDIHGMYWQQEMPANVPSYTPPFPPPPPILVRLLAGPDDEALNAMAQKASEVLACLSERLNRMTVQLGIDKHSLDCVVQQAIDSCTKDNIANARAIVVDTLLVSPAHANYAACFFVEKLVAGSSREGDSTSDSQARLHAVYLLNDVFFHSSRKPAKIEMLRTELYPPLPLIFAAAALRISSDGILCEPNQADVDRCSKLIKLLDLWRKNDYFKCSEDLVELAEEIACLGCDVRSEEYRESSSRLGRYINSFLEREFKPEHDRIMERQRRSERPRMPAYVPPYSGVPYRPIHHPTRDYLPRPRGQYAPLLSTPPPAFDPSQPPPGFPSYSAAPCHYPVTPPSSYAYQECHTQHPPISAPARQAFDYTPPKTTPTARNVRPEEQEEEEEKESSVPKYYELPAALICPLVKPSDCDYESIDPDLVKPVSPPTEEEMKRLSAALDQFYEQTRTKDGWEPSGLFEFYKEKFTCKIEKRKALLKGQGGQKERKGNSRSPSTDRSRSTASSRSPSTGRSISRSVSTSPRSTPERRRRRRGRRRRSISPDQDCKLTSAVDLHSERNVLLAGELSKSRPLDETNKGHQLLQKMGWSGTGLGKKEQGIVEPIRQGEIRDGGDKYKGVGLDNDPFDEFRKARSQKYSRFWLEKK